MSERSGKKILALVLGAVLVLIVAQTLNWALSLSSFEQTYRDSLLSRYRIIAKEFRAQVERDVNFGRPIHLLGNIRTVFSSIQALDEGIGSLYVTYPDGRIISSTEPETEGMVLGKGLLPAFPENPSESDLSRSEVTKIRGAYLVSLPVYYDGTDLQGSVHLRFDNTLIADRIGSVIRGSMTFFILVLAVAIAVLVLLLSGMAKFSEKLPARRAGFAGTAVIVTVLLGAQLTYAALNNSYFEKRFLSAFEENVDSLSGILKSEMEKVLEAGIPIERMKKAEIILANSRENSRESSSIGITDTAGNFLYYASPEGTWSVLEQGDSGRPQKLMLIATPVRRITPIGGAAGTDGFLVVSVNERLIRDQVADLLYDALTILVVSLVFSLELIRLLGLFIRRERKTEPAAGIPEQAVRTEDAVRGLQVIRIVSFVFFFAALIPLSFLPAFIEKIQQVNPVRIFSLSAQTIISLPIAAYMLGITIFIPVTGFLSARLSTKNVFFLSGGLFIAGTLATAFASDILWLIAARFVAGLGYGGTITNSTNLVIRSTTDANRSTGFGTWSAGFAAASICAISIGGVLVNRLGFTTGLLVAAGAAALLMVFYAFSMKDLGAAVQNAAAAPRGSGLKELLSVFRNRSLVVNLIFSSVPFSLAYIGLFQYIFPLYMGSSGVSAANIGRILTVYGLLSLITPAISRIADRVRNEKTIIIIGNSITALSLLGFFAASVFATGITPVLFLLPAILGIGLGGMMIDAVEESFIVSSEEARSMGEAKLLALYTTYDKIISISVPILAGLLISGFGFTGSIGAIGAFTALGVLVFAAFARNLRTERKPEPVPAGLELP